MCITSRARSGPAATVRDSSEFPGPCRSACRSGGWCGRRGRAGEARGLGRSGWPLRGSGKQAKAAVPGSGNPPADLSGTLGCSTRDTLYLQRPLHFSKRDQQNMKKSCKSAKLMQLDATRTESTESRNPGQMFLARSIYQQQNTDYIQSYVPRTYERLSWTPTPPAWPSYIPLGTGHPVPSLCTLQGRSHILHAFLKSVTALALAKEAKCKLTIPSKEQSNDDRWLQDEIEIGYIQAPHKTLPMVFDSPRNRDLKDFPIKCLLGPDFGYVT
ncbi:Protein-arginine deiminase type-4 [Vulpes lagopus]